MASRGALPHLSLVPLPLPLLPISASLLLSRSFLCRYLSLLFSNSRSGCCLDVTPCNPCHITSPLSKKETPRRRRIISAYEHGLLIYDDGEGGKSFPEMAVSNQVDAASPRSRSLEVDRWFKQLHQIINVGQPRKIQRVVLNSLRTWHQVQHARAPIVNRAANTSHQPDT